MCKNLLLLSLPIIGCLLMLPVRPKRAVLTYLAVYLLEVIFFGLIFLQLSDPCFWGFWASKKAMIQGLLVGSVGGLAIGFLGIKLNIAPIIHQGVINGQGNEWRLVRLVRSTVGGGILFIVLWLWKDPICYMFGLQAKAQCVSLLGGIIIGYFLGLLLLEGLWIFIWELRNHQKLYIEGIEMSKHWVRGFKS